MQFGLSIAQIIAAGLTVGLTTALSPRTKINDAYDFVIVGGGQAGLVLGARLSNSNHTVLVLESGGDGDEYRTRIGRRSFIATLQPALTFVTIGKIPRPTPILTRCGQRL